MTNTIRLAMWEIQMVLPASEERTYTRPVRVDVVARTAERALELARDRHPDGVTTNVVKRSGSYEDLIVDL